MFKRILILVVLFVGSMVILISFNAENDNGELFESYLCKESKIDKDDDLTIKLIDNSSDKLLDYKYRVTETDTLVDTIEIYRVKLYDLQNKDYEVNIENNVITINDYLGSVSIYQSLSFVTFAQFNKDYFQSVPSFTYEIYVPKGITLDIN